MSATLWDSFEDILKKAEDHFLNFRFEQAIEAWNNYYKITAKTEFQSFATEISTHWDAQLYQQIGSLSQLHFLFTELQSKRTRNQISQYTYDLYKRLLISIYRKQFSTEIQSTAQLESCVFEYLSGNPTGAQGILKQILDNDAENVQARIYLGFSHLDLHEQKEAVELLTQNLFLAADEIPEEALYLSQFKLLYGKLFADSGNREEAAWLLTFESWYRSYLVFTKNENFYRAVRHMESNERIVQVKYYSYERYRHFARCLFLAEYVRNFHKEESGLIQEQEVYMQKLDRELFARYRKKRRET